MSAHDSNPFELGAASSGSPASDRGRVVVVAATTRAILDGWAPGVALRLASGWARGGEGIVLVDADLAAPAFHDLAGGIGAAGLGDVLVQGGSLDRVVVALQGSSMALVPAGSFPRDPFSVMTAERWRKLVEPLVAGGAWVVVYVPAEEPWAGTILAEATDVIYLANPGESPVETLGHAERVRGVIDGEPDGEPAVDVRWPVVTFRDEARRDAEPAAPAPEADAAPAPGPGSGPVQAPEPPAPGAPPRPKAHQGATPRSAVPGRGSEQRWRSRALPAAAAVLALLAIGSWTGWFGLASRDVPQIPVEPPASGPSPVQTGAAPPLEAPSEAEPPTPVGPAPTFALALASYTNRTIALSRRQAFRARAPGVWFGLVPVEVRGRVFHRLMAGLAPDSASAETLRPQLGAALDEDPSAWFARRAHLAFLTSAFPTLEEAEGRVLDLEDEDLPAYVLEVDLSDGSRRYDVYVGAFANEGETGYTRDLLDGLGIRAELRERQGALPR